MYTLRALDPFPFVVAEFENRAAGFKEGDKGRL